MSGGLAVGFRRAGARVVVLGRLVRFSHSVFALPFAAAGVLFAAHATAGTAGPRTWLLVLLAMVAARTTAMTVNRIVDRRVDARNPRTAGREIPRGAVSVRAANTLAGVSAATFLLAAWLLNPLAAALAPIALAVVCAYSFTKRFTWMSHFVLGLSLGIAPVGGWVAVAGRLDLAPFVLAGAVLAWVAGFDILYALQDVDIDRAQGLHSVPARFGIAPALRLARVLHALFVVLLFAAGVLLDLAPGYAIGVSLLAVVLVLEHRLVRADDLSRLGRAFFDLNAAVSVLFLLAAGAGVW